MANYTPYIPSVGSTTYPTQISNFITISEAFDTEIEIARNGEANLLDGINLKLSLSGGTLTGALHINADEVAVKDAALTNTYIVSADASGRLTTSSGIVAANIVERSGTLTSGNVAVVTTNNDIQTTGLVAANIVERSGTLTSGNVAVVTTNDDIQTTGLVAANVVERSGTLTSGNVAVVTTNDDIQTTGLVAANIATLSGTQTFSGDKTFSGTINAITQATSNSTTLVATTQFVKNNILPMEESTWIPKIHDSSNSDGEGQTYYSQYGSYTKIGNRVIISARLDISSLGTLSGNMRIAGLPFTASSTANSHGVVTISATGLNITAGYSMVGEIYPTASYIALNLWDYTGGASIVQSGELTAISIIRLQGSYITDV